MSDTEAGHRDMALGPDVRALEGVVARRPHSLFSEDMAALQTCHKSAP